MPRPSQLLKFSTSNLAEICRAQVWQWLRHGSQLEDGRRITEPLVLAAIQDHVGKLRTRLPESQLFTAAGLLEELVTADKFAEFLTLRAYEHIE